MAGRQRAVRRANPWRGEAERGQRSGDSREHRARSARKENRYAKAGEEGIRHWDIPCDDAGHQPPGPTYEARAEAKLAWAMPCKEEEDEVN